MKESISFDEKFISNIFEKYLKAKVILQKNDVFLQEKSEQYGSVRLNPQLVVDYQKHLQIVETILSLLPKAEYDCLSNDFLYIEKSNSNWWKKDYSQMDYQKLKHKAINRFLYLFLI